MASSWVAPAGQSSAMTLGANARRTKVKKLLIGKTPISLLFNFLLIRDGKAGYALMNRRISGYGFEGGPAFAGDTVGPRSSRRTLYISSD